MEIIALALIGFVFVCIAMPQLVKHRGQFFIAVWGAIIIILLSAVAAMVDASGGLHRVLAGLIGIFDLLTFIVLIMCTGGMSLSELSSEMGSAYEIMRRGDTEKTVIIPLTGEQAKRRAAAAAGAADESPAAAGAADESPAAAPRVEIADPSAAAPRKSAPRENSSIPLE